MQDDNTQHAGNKNVGPFTITEIEKIARAAVLGMGQDFDHLKAGDRIGFVDEAKEILYGRTVSPKFGDLVHGATDAVRNQFKNLVLQEFRNSPKWDEAEFKAGYGSPAPIGDAATTGTGSEATR